MKINWKIKQKGSTILDIKRHTCRSPRVYFNNRRFGVYFSCRQCLQTQIKKKLLQNLKKVYFLFTIKIQLKLGISGWLQLVFFCTKNEFESSKVIKITVTSKAKKLRLNYKTMSIQLYIAI